MADDEEEEVEEVKDAALSNSIMGVFSFIGMLSLVDRTIHNNTVESRRLSLATMTALSPSFWVEIRFVEQGECSKGFWAIWTNDRRGGID